MDEKVNRIVAAINTQIYCDTSVEKSETETALRNIIAEIENMIEELNDN